ncbi:MAG: hypothetical protein ACRELZ_10905 [Candidatus Rokuibacteriota bacterium]
MKLTFKRREVSDLQHLRTLVADNADAMEPDLKILGSNLNLGRTNIEIAALDAQRCPVLFVLGLTADDAMLVRALEAYAWCLEYPESVQRLVPANTQLAWPPRIVFVAERLLEAFVRKMRLLNFSAVDCFEFRYVEANGTTGFYLDRVDWAAAAGATETAARRPERAWSPERLEPPLVEEPAAPPEPPRVAPREEPTLVRLRDEAREDLEEPEALVEEPVDEIREELVEEAREEPKVTPREEPRVIPLVPVEEPRIVMLHETKPAPRIVEPAPTNGAAKRDSTSSQRSEPTPVLLRGLRPPSEAPPRRRSREVPDLLRPSGEPRAPGPRETSKPPAPAAPAASRGSHVEPKAAPAAHARSSPQAIDPRVKSDAARADLAKNGSKSDPARSDLPKGDLAPTWRKFLDRLTSTFDTRPTPATEPPRAAAPPATPAPPPGLTLQPFAADIEIHANEVAPDEAVDESHDSIGDLNEKQRKILSGLTLPDNGELAPQWRKFLDHPTLDETKISVVRGYLQREFPLCTVYDFFDFQRNAQVFQLQDNHGKVTQLITMTAEFFDGHRDLEIRAWIEKHRLAQAMRQAGQAGVLVSQAGLQIEKR